MLIRRACVNKNPRYTNTSYCFSNLCYKYLWKYSLIVMMQFCIPPLVRFWITFWIFSHHVARHWISAPVIRNTVVFNITCYFQFHLICDHWCYFLLYSASFITIICSSFLAAILGCFISWVNNIYNKLQIVVICKCKGMLTPLQIQTTPWQLWYSSSLL